MCFFISILQAVPFSYRSVVSSLIHVIISLFARQVPCFVRHVMENLSPECVDAEHLAALFCVLGEALKLNRDCSPALINNSSIEKDCESCLYQSFELMENMTRNESSMEPVCAW